MAKIRRILFVCAALFVVTLSAISQAQLEGYTLNAGDAVRVYVYGEPELSFDNLLVGQNGRIAYPFLGEITVSGKSAAGVQSLLINGLKPDYLVDPRVSVSVVKYRSFFVNGEVKSPGGLDFQPGLTLRKAISLAGGFTERANRKKIFVITDSDQSRSEQEVGLDYKVQPGDIFTVRDTFF